MATIQSGASSDLLTIDPVSKAARVTLYNSAGEELIPKPTGGYMLPISLRPTAAVTNTVWAMRAGSSLTLYIRRIQILAAFDGTNAGSAGQYDLVRFTTATPTGGTAITPIKKRSSWPTSNVIDVRFADAGLTTTSVVFETSMASAGCARQISSTNILIIDFIEAGDRYFGIELAPNEGLCIRTGVAAVAGDSLRGFIEWDER